MRFFQFIFIGLTSVAMLAVGAQAQTRMVPQSRTDVQLSYSPLVSASAPAVVNIYTKKVVQARRSTLFDDPFFRRFFGDRFSFSQPKERVRGSLGSGVIVRPDGVIVTNNHVIDGADEITIVLADRREFEAQLVLADPRTDLAILRIDSGAESLSTLSLADSDTVEVGDIVLAIGNPFGIGQTVTSGIVSASARTQRGISDFGFFIQTDAAVNPGNSGGALIGLDGKLMGINTAIYSRTGTSNGIGFAIPANMVESVVRAALNEGELARPWLGIVSQSVTTELAKGLGLDRAGGVLVDNIYPGGPAELAGLMVGDVIMALNDREIIDEAQLKFRTATRQPGERIMLTLLRGGELVVAQLELAMPPETPARSLTELDGNHPFQGVEIANLNPRFNDELQIDPFRTGVVVLSVGPRTPAARFQFLTRGDILLEVNNITIAYVADAVQILEAPADQYLYKFLRQGRIQECLIVPNRSKNCRVVG